MIYMIATVRPSMDVRLEQVLLGLGVKYSYPREIVSVRVGRKRERATKSLPVIPGLFFVDERRITEVAEEHERRGGTLRLLKNHADFDRYAKVTSAEIADLLSWVESQNRKFRPQAPEPQKPEPTPREPLPVGSMATILSGPFAGVQGRVEADDGEDARLSLDGGMAVLRLRSCALRGVALG